MPTRPCYLCKRQSEGAVPVPVRLLDKGVNMLAFACTSCTETAELLT